MPAHDVLIVSSTPLLREVFHDMLATEGYMPLLAGDGCEALEAYRGWRPAAVVTDFGLLDMTGLELLLDLREEDPDAAVIILCGAAYERRGQVVGFLDLDAVRAAGRTLGVYAVLAKPVDMNHLLLAVQAAIEVREVALERRQVLPRRWQEVRPLAGVSELLGMFAAVFSVPSPRREPMEGVRSRS